MRAILGGTLAVVLCLGSGLLAEDKKADPIDAKKLVGKWEPKEKKEGVRVVLEFNKDGKASLTRTDDGVERTFGGTYKVDGNKVTTILKWGDKEQTDTRTVSKLTDTEMVSTDEKGREITLVRLKDK